MSRIGPFRIRGMKYQRLMVVDYIRGLHKSWDHRRDAESEASVSDLIAATENLMHPELLGILSAILARFTEVEQREFCISWLEKLEKNP